MKRRTAKQTATDTFETVKALGLTLAQVEAATKHDRSRVLKLGGYFTTGLATHPLADANALSGRTSLEDRDWFIADLPRLTM